MRHIAAYLLLQIGGNTNPSAEDVKRVLAAVGIEADDARLTKLIQELEGKDINEIIASGSKELAVPSAPSRAGADSSAAGRDLEHGRKVEKDDTELDGDGPKDDDSDDGLEILFDGLFS